MKFTRLDEIPKETVEMKKRTKDQALKVGGKKMPQQRRLKMDPRCRKKPQVWS